MFVKDKSAHAAHRKGFVDFRELSNGQKVWCGHKIPAICGLTNFAAVVAGDLR